MIAYTSYFDITSLMQRAADFLNLLLFAFLPKMTKILLKNTFLNQNNLFGVIIKSIKYQLPKENDYDG